MGQRGPKPLPANVHLLRGNPSKKAIGDLYDELRPEVELPDYPSWLWPEAKKEFKRVGAELVRYGLVSKLCRSALCQYVQAWAEWAWAKQRLSKAVKDAEKGRQDAEEKGLPWTGGDGVMVPTAGGNFIYSHYWVMAKQASSELDKHQIKFGLHAAARGRVSTSDNRQSSLFEEGSEDEWQAL